MNPGDLPPGFLTDAQIYVQIVSFFVGALSAIAFTLAFSYRG